MMSQEQHQHGDDVGSPLEHSVLEVLTSWISVYCFMKESLFWGIYNCVYEAEMFLLGEWTIKIKMSIQAYVL